MLAVFALLALTAASFALTWGLRRLAMRYQVIDVPNARSSHIQPTPRGGGLAIVFVVTSGWTIGSIAGVVDGYLAFALVLGGLLVAIIGVTDDLGHVAAKWRLMVHFLSAGAVIFMIGGITSFTFAELESNSYWVGTMFSIFFIVWTVNLYNFMDGIDGIAGIESVTVCGSAAALYLLTDEPGMAWLVAVVGSATFGFLLWNWAPAKIFLGDVGSGFLGLVFGALAIASHNLSDVNFIAWLILLGVFIADATITLVRRIIQRKRIYEAHRSHAYQIAAIKHESHAMVSLFVACINLFWLFPIALFVVNKSIPPLVGLLIAYSPLLWLTMRYRAGEESGQDTV
jgi:Fuc2NAc and GlcNAc transferase